MSRKHVEPGMFTLHPGGIAHGPHLGNVEKSIGQKETKELAVMIDTFKPLLMTETSCKYRAIRLLQKLATRVVKYNYFG